MVMIAVVSVLAVYQCIDGREKSENRTSAFQKIRLDTSVRNFEQEFSYDFQQRCESLSRDPEVEAVGHRKSPGAPTCTLGPERAHPAEMINDLSIWKRPSATPQF